MLKKKYLFAFTFLFLVSFISCVNEFGKVVISKPDEYKQVYGAKEGIILKSVAMIIKEKKLGENVTIDHQNQNVDSDYVVSSDWRTKTSAHVNRLNWKECELLLTVISEKKTSKGWELRRVFQKEQYDSLFNLIDLKIYEEISRGE